MFDIEIYRDRTGYSEIAEWIKDLNTKAITCKNSRIRLKKIVEYIEYLKAFGTQIGEPAVKHIKNSDLWELRPTRDRIFFFYWKDNTFVLLHHFVKKTQKTPSREVERAQHYLKDFLERSE